MTRGKENNVSKLVSIRLRKDLLVRLEERATELGVPYQTVLQGLLEWGLDRWDTDSGPSDQELSAITTRRTGRPKKEACTSEGTPSKAIGRPVVSEPDPEEDEGDTPESMLAGLNLDIVGLK